MRRNHRVLHPSECQTRPSAGSLSKETCAVEKGCITFPQTKPDPKAYPRLSSQETKRHVASVLGLAPLLEQPDALLLHHQLDELVVYTAC